MCVRAVCAQVGSRSSAALDVGRLASLWRGGSGGTYLWHMVERDVVTRYTPSGGTLRIYVVGRAMRAIKSNMHYRWLTNVM